MFWRFGGYSNISTIDTLLDKQNVSLEELLDESDLIQELKSHNTKLIEYLRDDTTLEKLLKYVVAPGPPVEEEGEDEDNEDSKGKAPEKSTDVSKKEAEEKEKTEKQRVKHAFVACEILSCETWSITEALMSNVPLLVDFWDFLRQPPSLDPLQAGYFTKVNETLLEKKTEDMLEFFKSLPGIVPSILQHVDCPMVMDLLLKIISLEKAEGGQGTVDWLHSQDLIPTLLSYLEPNCESSTQTSAGDFLKAIITISANAAQNEQSCIGPNSLTRQLVSESCMETLIESMLKGGNPLTVGVGIVIEVIRKNNSDYDPENGHNPGTPPSNHDPIYLGTLLRMFARHIPDFMSLILSSKHTIVEGDKPKVVERGELPSAWGTKIEPLGFDRFKTCELMAELLHCSNMGLLNERGSEDFIRERDAERERLRSQGAFSQKPSEDSAIDISATSSRFENGFNSSIGNSTEELRLTNSSEDDGFETVAVSDATDDNQTNSATFVSPVDEEGLMDAQQTSPKIRPMELLTSFGEPKQPPTIELLSPTTANLNEKVRRLSLEDVSMTSPPNESEDSTPIDEEPNFSPTSPHLEFQPPPLFSKSADPNKTPTPASPEPPTTPKSPRSPLRRSQDISLDSQIEGNSTFDDPSDPSGPSDMAQPLHSDKEAPVVGDYLKLMFIENKVVPTILSFFFRFPWNNFLHNVVYDVVQQVFNGPMERGHNRYLAFDLFETGKITEQIIQGQEASDEAQRTRKMRLGYMGHLTLVAEEVVKFGERHPREVLSPKVQDYVYGRDWEEYVTKTLAETRERDNAILGGFRPDTSIGPRQAVLNAVSSGQGLVGSAALANVGLGGFQQPLDSMDLSNNGSATSGIGSGAGSLMSNFASSSDDEDEDMEDGEDGEQSRSAYHVTMADPADEVDGNLTSIPLIPPPPAPLKIKPSQARQRLERRLAMQKQQAAEEESSAAEFGSASDDPFASLGDEDDEQDGVNAFTLNDEQDITSFGTRSQNPFSTNEDSNSNTSHAFTVSRGLTSLFSGGSRLDRQHENQNHFNQSIDEDDESSSSSGSGSDMDPDNPPLEAKRSNERRPLDIGDDDNDQDEDEEMGEMVGPESSAEEQTTSSDEDESAHADTTITNTHRLDDPSPTTATQSQSQTNSHPTPHNPHAPHPHEPVIPSSKKPATTRRRSRPELEMDDPVSEFDGQSDRSSGSSDEEAVAEMIAERKAAAAQQQSAGHGSAQGAKGGQGHGRTRSKG